MISHRQDLTLGLDQPQTFSATTDNNGDYVIPFIYYGLGSEEATYEIVPTLDGHEFDPSSNTLVLKAGDFTKTQHFIDTTSFVISGYVRSAISNCGLESVTIREPLGQNNGVIPTQTDGNGFYEAVVPEPGSYQLEAVYEFDHESIPDSTATVMILNSDVSGIDFLHEETDTLRGFVGAGCEDVIGVADLEVKSPSGCLIASGSTDANGFYEFVLPSRPIVLQVTNFNLDPDEDLVEGEVLAALYDTVEIDLLETTEINFIYRKPIQLEITGIPAPSCAALPYPILKQDNFYSLTIKVWEEVNVCLADTGVVYLTDFWSGTTSEPQVLDTVPITNGIAIYNFQVGEPALLEPFLKGLTVTAVVGEQIASETFSGIVTGSRQRGATFTTAAPTSLPFLILRDPPGDGSYSFFEENETIKYGQSFWTKTDDALNAWAKAKVGVSIFGLSVWGEVGASFGIDVSNSTTEQLEVQISNTNYFSTSNNPMVIGTEGDLFVGAAVNFIYSLADERRFDLNTCSIVKDTVLMLNANGFETTFMYTESYIRNNVIPDLQFILNNPMTPDSIKSRFESEISVWQQTLQLNEDLKVVALSGQTDNYSFDGAIGPFSQTRSGSSTESRTIEFTQKIDFGIAAALGVSYSGFVDVSASAGVDVKFRTTVGERTTTSQTNSTTTGFHIDDDDGSALTGYDAFSFEVGTDPVYGTSVFGNLVGQTSCPHEPGTVKRDEMSMTVLNPVIESNTNDAFFLFTLANLSESDETRKYMLAFNAASALGAEVYNGSNNFTDPIPFIIDAGGQIQQIIRVHRPEGLPFYSFEGLEFRLYPECDPFFSKKVNISAYFDSPCSAIEMEAPVANWLINQGNNDMLSVTMIGYDLNTDIQEVILQYKNVDSDSWISSNISVTENDLLNSPNGTDFMWDVSAIEDGTYDIRFRLFCGSTFSYSPRVSGLIDRRAPMVYGLEKPLNDNFEIGSEISVRFDEEIVCNAISNANARLTRVSDSTLIPVTILCTGDQVQLIPAIDISTQIKEAFICELFYVEDLYGNIRSDTVSWVFVVGDPDTDGDGISDSNDRCPGGDDFVDSDLGGLPDDCDCLPLNQINDNLTLINENNIAMDFDGVDDHLTVPNNPDLMPLDTASLTFEAWIYPENVSGYRALATSANTLTVYNFAVYIWNGQILATSQNAQVLFSNGVVPVNEWSHVAVVFNADSAATSIYINGELDITLQNAGFGNTNLGQDILIGDINSVDWHFDGKMDEVRFWFGVRDQQQIQGFMNQELKGIELNLMAYYNYNQGIASGDNTGLAIVQDQSPRGNDATLNDFVQNGSSSNWVSSDVELLTISNDTLDLCLQCADSDTTNAALHFDGIDDQISIGNSFSAVHTNFTYEFWANPQDSIFIGAYETNFGIVPSVNNYMPAAIFPNQGGIAYGAGHATSGVTVGKNGIIVFEHSDNYYARPLVHYMPIVGWTHIAIVYENNQPKLYVDGEFVKQGIQSGQSFVHPASEIGGFIPTQFFKGTMDDLRYWDYSRSESEIISDIQQEIVGNESGLVMYYNFNNGEAGEDNTGLTMTPDVSSSGINGTMSGFSNAGNSSNWVASLLNFADGDKDGLPDICDDCFAIKDLLLENLILNGTYRGRETITIGQGVTFGANADIFLRAPKVKVVDPVNPQFGVNMTIMKDPCEIE